MTHFLITFGFRPSPPLDIIWKRKFGRLHVWMTGGFVPIIEVGFIAHRTGLDLHLPFCILHFMMETVRPAP